MGDQISSDGIHANHDEWERPFSASARFDDPTEGGKRQETESSAEQSPAGSPDALYNGADSCEVKEQTRGNSPYAGKQKFLEWDLRSNTTQPPAGDQTQNHGAERGNKTQGEVATIIGHEGRSAREQIQEPLVESIAEIGVLVPVGKESGKIVGPISRNAYRLLVEGGIRNGVQSPFQSVS